MRLSDYYAQTDDRSSGWVERSAEPGFAPCADLIHASRAYLRKGGRVLDIGCQGGHQLALIQEDYREAVGIDIADYSAMWKRSPAIRFRVHDVDAEPLPFPDGHFSCVVCTNVLEHVFDVFQLVREIGRVLERGGTGLIAVPNVTSFRHIISLVRGRIPRTGTNRYPFTETDGWDGQHLHFFSPAELDGLLLTAGLVTTRRCHVGSMPGLKRLFPALLDGSIVVVVTKQAGAADTANEQARAASSP